MLTKNAYAFIFGRINQTESVQMKNIDGTDKTIKIGTSTFDAFQRMFSSYSVDSPVSSGLYFGDGDTPPSVNDYKFSGNIVRGLEYNSVNISMNQTGEYVELQATLAVRNTSAVTRTVKEIGFFGYISINMFLMDRIVLSTPLTWAVGETKSITYNLRHTY